MDGRMDGWMDGWGREGRREVGGVQGRGQRTRFEVGEEEGGPGGECGGVEGAGHGGGVMVWFGCMDCSFGGCLIGGFFGMGEVLIWWVCGVTSLQQ